MKSLQFSFRGFAAEILVLGALVSVAACTALRPGHQSKDQHSVSVVMNASSLPQEVLDRMKNLRMRAFSLAGDARGPQDGADAMFSLAGFTGQREFKIEGLQLGNKDLVLDVLDAANATIGTGSLRVLVQPGLNLVQEKLIIKLIPLDQRVRNVPIEVAVGAAGTTTGTTWSDVKGLFVTGAPYRCVQCHNADPDSNNGLDLSAFPFKSDSTTDQKTIVASVIQRVKGAGGYMPPGNGQKMTAGEVESLTKWLDGGLQQGGGSSPQLSLSKLEMKWECGDEKGEILLTPKPGEANRYIAELKNLKIGEKLKFKLKAKGTDDVILGETANSDGWIIDGTSPLKLNLSINTASPSVAIQVEIVQ